MIRQALKDGAALAALILLFVALMTWADIAITLIHRS